MPAIASTTAPTTSPSSATWLSISFARSRQRAPCASRSSGRDGRTHSSPKSSLTFEMRLPWPWEGLVKNRTKTGDHYWVRANVTPLIEDGEISGFISIRPKPARSQVDQAERAYACLIDKSDKTLGVHEGALVRRGWWQNAGSVLV